MLGLAMIGGWACDAAPEREAAVASHAGALGGVGSRPLTIQPAATTPFFALSFVNKGGMKLEIASISSNFDSVAPTVAWGTASSTIPLGELKQPKLVVVDYGAAGRAPAFGVLARWQPTGVPPSLVYLAPNATGGLEHHVLAAPAAAPSPLVIGWASGTAHIGTTASGGAGQTSLVVAYSLVDPNVDGTLAANAELRIIRVDLQTWSVTAVTSLSSASLRPTCTRSASTLCACPAGATPTVACWQGLWFPSIVELQSGALAMTASEQLFHPKNVEFPVAGPTVTRKICPGKSGRDEVLVFLKSSDDGASWSLPSIVAQSGCDDINEASLTQLGNGVLVTAYHQRTPQDPLVLGTSRAVLAKHGPLYFSASNRGGATWATGQPIIAGPYNSDLRFPELRARGDEVVLLYTEATRHFDGDALYNTTLAGLTALAPYGSTTWYGRDASLTPYHFAVGADAHVGAGFFQPPSPSGANAAGAITMRSVGLDFRAPIYNQVAAFDVNGSRVSSLAIDVTTLKIERCVAAAIGADFGAARDACAEADFKTVKTWTLDSAGNLLAGALKTGQVPMRLVLGRSADWAVPVATTIPDPDDTTPPIGLVRFFQPKGDALYRVRFEYSYLSTASCPSPATCLATKAWTAPAYLIAYPTP